MRFLRRFVSCECLTNPATVMADKNWHNLDSERSKHELNHPRKERAVRRLNNPSPLMRVFRRMDFGFDMVSKPNNDIAVD